MILYGKQMSDIRDLSNLIASCSVELKRINESWTGDRVSNFCEKATGHRNWHFLNEAHFEILLRKLQAEPTAYNSVKQLNWKKLEDSPVETVLASLIYCNSWEDFVSLTEGCGVDDSNLESYEQLWFLLRARGYASLVMGWRDAFLKAQKEVA